MTTKDKKASFIANFSSEKILSKDVSQEALEAIKTLELPSTKDEYWKYTRLGKITNPKYSRDIVIPTSFAITNHCEGVKTNRLIFINGVFSPEHSLVIDQNINLSNIQGATDKPEFKNTLVKFQIINHKFFHR